MRFSELFTKTLKETPADEPAKNAQLLMRGGFIYKNSAGVYTFLPLGWKVIEKINKIVREEMNAIGGVEIFMPALVEKKYLDYTGRFNVSIGFDVLGKMDKEASYALGWTHEEVLTAIASKYINSYKDLPLALYQIQTKFRNEPRAKSGLLRGREFLMKDLYSFHADEKNLFEYYERVKGAYLKIFERCGLKALYTVAGGGDFTISNTHEFQVLAEAGEDEILYCKDCNIAENAEITKHNDGDKCSSIGCCGKIKRGNSIEVGNIFPLGTKYSQAFNLKFNDENGNKKFVVMGSYGIGVSRVMGTAVEIYNDERGIIWSKEIAPFAVQLVRLASGRAEVKKTADKIYQDLLENDIEVLYDDRDDATAGEKFADADLLGMPWRIVISDKTLNNNNAELKRRSENNIILCSLNFLDISQKILA